MLINFLLPAVIGYLLGSISTGILYSRHFLGKDVRTSGSKNAGASNMLRVHGVKSGVITFAGDCIKAIIAVVAGKLLGGQAGGMIAGLFAVIGHNWPVYFSFKGGKGIACCSAVFILCYPIWGIISAVIAILTIWIWRFISLGSLVMTAVYALLLLFFEGVWPVGIWALILMALAFCRHRGNISRLLHGTERKIGEKEKA